MRNSLVIVFMIAIYSLKETKCNKCNKEKEKIYLSFFKTRRRGKGQTSHLVVTTRSKCSVSYVRENLYLKLHRIVSNLK